MNDADDPFEAELHALRPLQPSADLPARLAARLAEDRAAVWKDRVGGALAVLSGLVAAAVLLVAFWARTPEEPSRKAPLVKARLSIIQETLPTFGAYQHALTQSPEAAEALVNRYTVLSQAAYQPLNDVRAFPFAHADLPDLLGDRP